MQLRRLSAKLVEVSDSAAGAPGPLRLQARVLRPAAVFGAQTRRATSGSGMHLVNPMHPVTLPSGRAAVVMRQLQVHPHTAQPAGSWLIMHQPAARPDGRERYTVGDFRLG